MATMAQSLNDLAEELTCSICLSPFTTPVTIPCGHNFCFHCMDLTWKRPFLKDYSCPQCRTTFDTKPELRKNTLLNNLVKQVMAARGDRDSDGTEEECAEEEEEEMDNQDVVLCDNCMKVAACMTCLTCMASFCNDHLMPHIESPAFRDHQLKKPLKDLQQRKCAEHNKLLEYYCWEHSKCICCYCLVGHKQCQTFGLQEGKMKKELQFNNLLASLNDKIEKNSNTLDEVSVDQRKVKDITQKKKDLLEGAFDEIKARVEVEQRKAMNRIEEEERKVDGKYSWARNALGKKKDEFETLIVKVESLLREDDDLQFLKSAMEWRDTTSADPFKPKIEFDEKLLNQIYSSALSLKEMIRTELNQPDEAPELKTSPPAQEKKPGVDKEPKKKKNKKTKNLPLLHVMLMRWETPLSRSFKLPSLEMCHSYRSKTIAKRWISIWSPVPLLSFLAYPLNKNLPANPAVAPQLFQFANLPRPPVPVIPPLLPLPYPFNKNLPANLAVAATPALFANPPQPKPRRNPPGESAASADSCPHSREVLLTYAERLTVDPNTAHKRVILSDRFTKLTVTDNPQNYADNPLRFTSCSQVLCCQGFSQGIHYWEVDLEGGNFSGIGIAYQSIARKGTESRLGRNKVSWCIEWFNGKLAAFHDDIEKKLPIQKTSNIGVLLNFDEGFLAFYSVSKNVALIYKFRARFTEPVFPAFWVFSSNTVLSISRLG
ncbi:E3 ubiquitin/ISG15 ligase TRIM25-like [Ascaphus truei]|uniref:E3 ubiquitin/ISG15 ligase TRIM25-like n=1 Tax=Ascaphus truei TaxID=8439 RepID=UPI003F5A9A13